MRIIVGSRRSGKTTDLVKMSAEKGYYIVTSSIASARLTSAVARKLGLTIPMPITYAEFLDGRDRKGLNIPGVVIDNLELFLKWISDVPVKAIAMSTGKECIGEAWKHEYFDVE